jgi:hypothetical protein
MNLFSVNNAVQLLLNILAVSLSNRVCWHCNVRLLLPSESLHGTGTGLPKAIKKRIRPIMKMKNRKGDVKSGDQEVVY